MPRSPLPPIALAVSFIDAINRQDLEALAHLLSNEHELRVQTQPPVVGREANRDAWRAYFGVCPDYVVYPEEVIEADGVVAILGHTTGSHLRLPDEEERAIGVVWRAETTADGHITVWEVLDDSTDLRIRLGFRR